MSNGRGTCGASTVVVGGRLVQRAQHAAQRQLLQLPLLDLRLELLDVLRTDLHKQNAIDKVEHIDDGRHAGRLDVQRRRRGRGVGRPRVCLREPLLQHHGLLRQVAQAFRGLAGLLVFLAQQLLIDRVSLLLMRERGAEVSEAGQRAREQVPRHRRLQRARPVRRHRHRQRALREPQRQLVLAHRVQDQRDVAIK